MGTLFINFIVKHIWVTYKEIHMRERPLLKLHIGNLNSNQYYLIFHHEQQAISWCIEQKEERVLLENNTNVEVYKTRAMSTLILLTGNHGNKQIQHNLFPINYLYEYNLSSRNIRVVTQLCLVLSIGRLIQINRLSWLQPSLSLQHFSILSYLDFLT